MTTTDTDALKERIRRARSVPAEWAKLRDGETTMEQIERHQERMDEQAAALIAAEVRKARHEAWVQGAATLDESGYYSHAQLEAFSPYRETEN